MYALGSILRQQARTLASSAMPSVVRMPAPAPSRLFSTSTFHAEAARGKARQSAPEDPEELARRQKEEIDRQKEMYSLIIDSLQHQLPNGRSASPQSGRGPTLGNDLEANWAMREIHGEASWPATPHSGRSINVTATSDAARAYGQLSVLLRRNDVRNELRLQDRFEKPNQQRRRKESMRHRRRFADLVRKKVQLVMSIKARGA